MAEHADSRAYRAMEQDGFFSGLSGVAASSGVGGRFAFRPDELAAIVRDWNELADSYLADIDAAEIVKRVEGPGTENASKSLARGVKVSGEALAKSLAAEREYCLAQAKKFQSALGAYVETEQAVLGDLNRNQGGLI